MACMAFVLMVLGFVIGAAISGAVEGGVFGLLIASAVWLIMMLISYSSGDQIFLAASKAKPVTHDVHPQLFNIVEEMKIAAALPAMPKVYIINDPAPNAFATGRTPETASVAVTAGLLARLNRDELQGVIAHEISHILHRDILFVTLAGVMLGSSVYPSAQAKKFESVPKTLPRRSGTWGEWFEAVQGGEPAGCHFEWAAYLTEFVLLGNIAIRVGKPLEWDAEKAQFTNAPEANQYVKEKYREGWTLS